MFESFYAIDSTAFRLVNSGTANPVFDLLLPFLTEVRNFYIPYALLFILLIWKGGPRGIQCALLLAVTVAIADPLSSRVIKEEVTRIRPCHILEGVRLLVPCGAGKSFPSSHAVNNFAAAVIIGYFFRGSLPYALAFAAVIAFSRVYVGVHYPADILGGAMIGAGVAGAVLWAWEMGRRRYERGKMKREGDWGERETGGKGEEKGAPEGAPEGDEPFSARRGGDWGEGETGERGRLGRGEDRG